ncbi:MAG: hypothetical protein H0T89_13460 [Deltaproteobacteria bacterium]|nr:hypothetical protein [Deltaproteobacteria bacterium]MDQ3301235.1 hypothetical protein [Myxococcota bacterium]
MTNPFSRTTLAIIIGVAAVSLGVAVALTVIGDDLSGGQPSAGADSYSVSAIGHRGLVEMLGRLDVPVVKSRSESGGKATRGVLIIAEPTVSDDASKERLRALVKSAPRVLVVLPKWYGSAGVGETWIDEANRLPTSEVDDVLETIGAGARIDGTAGSGGPAVWSAPELDMERFRLVIPSRQRVTTGETEDAIAGDGLGEVVIKLASVDGDEREVWVLTDPDVLNNHGLRHPDNALFAINLIDHVRDGGPVVLDEVIHGYAQQPSLLRTLFQFPLVLATLQVLICALLAVWAAMVRFGPRRAAPPPLAPGKDFLIQNTAALLHYGGHHADALRRYLAHSIAAVRHALHAPTLAPGAMTAWLESVRKNRGGTIPLPDLERDTLTADTPQRTVEIADRVYRWRMEMINGSQHRT